MSLPYGDEVSVVLSSARIDLQDNSNSPRWGDAQLLQYANDALRELALASCFRRTDVIPPDGSVYYKPFCEPVECFAVWYNKRKLAPLTEAEAQQQFGITWANLRQDPTAYIWKKFIRLVPVPGGSGTPLTYAGAPSITEAEGKGPGGHRWWSFNNAGTLHHFLPGDGTVADAYATGNIWVEYSYMPAALGETDKLERKYVQAVRDYIVYRCLARSDDKMETQQAGQAYQDFEKFKQAQAAKESKASAEWIASFPMDQHGWENRGIGGIPRLLAGY